MYNYLNCKEIIRVPAKTELEAELQSRLEALVDYVEHIEEEVRKAQYLDGLYTLDEEDCDVITPVGAVIERINTFMEDFNL